MAIVVHSLTIVAFHLQKSRSDVHQGAKELGYQDQKKTFVPYPRKLHSPFEGIGNTRGMVMSVLSGKKVWVATKSYVIGIVG
jgi:hypothetical protein